MYSVTKDLAKDRVNELRGHLSGHPTGKRKYSLNKEFFSEYTPESCYVAGFIAADGCVCKGLLTISLSIVDEEFLVSLKDLLSSTAPVRQKDNNGNPCVRLDVHSVELVGDLKEYFDIRENKSLTFIPPLNKIPLNMRKYFMLGMFDGDGTITGSFINQNYFNPSYGITGTQETCVAFKDFVGKPDIKLFQRHPERCNNNFQISFTGINNLESFYYKVYDETSKKICLPRKLTKIENFLKIHGRLTE